MRRVAASLPNASWHLAGQNPVIGRNNPNERLPYPGIIDAVRQVIGKPHEQTALDSHAKEDSSAAL
jgi:hypothetical protein